MRFRKVAAAAALVALITTISAPAGAAEGARGTGEASITGLSVDMDNPNLDLSLVDLSSVATRDADRANDVHDDLDVDVDLARGVLTPALSTVTDVGPVPVGRVTVQRSADNTGTDQHSVVGSILELPGTLADEELALDRGTPIGTVNAIADEEGASIAVGDYLRATVPPDELSAVFTDDADFTGGAGVDNLSALGGLVSLDDLTVGEEQSWSEVDRAGGAVRAFTMDDLTVLDLEAFLHLLGLSLEDLPLDVLTGLADELGLDLEGTVGDLQLTAYDTWDELRSDLDETRDELESLAGETCDALTDPISDLLGDVGVVCDSVDEALADVNDLIDDLLDAVTGVLSGAALLSLEDVAGEVQAVAEVDETANALTSATAIGRVGDIKVGGVSIGSIDADLTKETLSAVEAKIQTLAGGVNEQLDKVLVVLGEAYTGLVDVLPIAVLEQSTRIDGQYAVAEAALTLLQVRISLPETLEDVTGLTDGDDGSGDSTTTTSSTTTTTLLPDPGDLLDVSNVRPISSVQPQVDPLATSVTIEVGKLTAYADHTRDVEITGGGDNRTFDSRTGFSDGPIPRTGGETSLVLLIAAVLVTGGWLGRRALGARAVPSA